jgi:hypothetical protein
MGSLLMIRDPMFHRLQSYDNHQHRRHRRHRQQRRRRQQ